MKPIDGMTTEPYGLPLMAGDWLACVLWAAGEPEIVADFERETGRKLDALFSRGINELIDEATGHRKATLIAWADWITERYWGTAEATAAMESSQEMTA